MRATAEREPPATSLTQPSIVNAVPGDGDGQGDARIAGTNYYAVTPVSCLLYRMLVPDTCEATAIHAHAAGKTIHVEIRWQGDIKQTLIFSANGKFLNAAPAGTLAAPGKSTFRLSGDAMWVTVGSEWYEIPDILLQHD